MDIIITIIIILGLYFKPEISVHGFLTGLKESITKK